MSIEYSQVLVEKLYNKYQKKMLTRYETAKELGMSVQTLDRLKRAGLGPKYIKNGNCKSNGAVRYSIYAIAEFIITNQVITA